MQGRATSKIVHARCFALPLEVIHPRGQHKFYGFELEQVIGMDVSSGAWNLVTSFWMLAFVRLRGPFILKPSWVSRFGDL